MTTLLGRDRAEALGEALERLPDAPMGVGVFELEDGSGLWEVGGYFSQPPDQTGLAILAVAFGANPFAVSRLDDTDWVAQVRRELHPVRAGRFVVHGGHDADQIGAHEIGLRIEAAMAFGTGHHATTQGCLLALDRIAQVGLVAERVADIGCGTGVLAMAAVRRFRAFAVASDIEDVAAATAAANARVNRIAPPLVAVCAPGFRNPVIRRTAPYDLIFANILAGALKRLAPEIARHLAPQGIAVLSGLLAAQAAGVAAVFRGHGLRVVATVTLAGWTTLLVASRRGWLGPVVPGAERSADW